MNIHVPMSDVLQRVFAISVDTKTYGSCLAFPVNGLFYLITAAHVIKEMPHERQNDLHIFKDNQWIKMTVIPHFVAGRSYVENDIDIAVIKTSIPVGIDKLNTDLSPGKLIMGQDIYFLGFPYFGTSIDYKSAPSAFNGGFPIPFIKKGICSAIRNPIVYLDGHNNPGFSGGPVVYWDHDSNKQKVLAIVSGYLPHTGEIGKIESSSELFYKENSGIAIAYDIKCATDLIQKIKS